MSKIVPGQRPAANRIEWFTATDEELTAWLDSLPDDVAARDEWTDGAEAARLRELEECERVGGGPHTAEGD